MQALCNDRISVVVSPLTRPQVLRSVYNFVRRVGVGRLVGITNFFVWNENLLFGFVVFEPGLADELFRALQAEARFVNKVINAIRCFPQHHVVNVVSKINAYVRTAVFNA